MRGLSFLAAVAARASPHHRQASVSVCPIHAFTTIHPLPSYQLSMKDPQSATTAADSPVAPATVDAPTKPVTLHTPPAAGADDAPAKRVRLTPVSDASGAEAPLEVLRVHKDARMPVRGSPHSAGFDLAAAQPATIAAGRQGIVKTGLKMRIPPGLYGRVAPRSGLAVKHMVDVGAGVIDADYRGEVGVVLFNFGEKPFEVAVGDRVAQLVLEKISMADVLEVEGLDDTQRGEGGFGSTGVSVSTK